MNSQSSEKLSAEDEQQLLRAVKASALLAKSEGIERVTNTAGRIFDKNHEPLAVSALRLKEAQQAVEKLDVEIAELERELKKVPPTVSNVDTFTQKEENHEEE